MGRKKKKQIKPWCWYCNREFDDEKILIQHQKSKHFKCSFCHKKLYTGPGLSIHSIQVHKEKIDKIPYALPNRCNVDLEIYGMEGIPDEDIKEHERNKSGKEDEVEDKRIKLEYTPGLSNFPAHSIPVPPVAPRIPFMTPMSLPVMPPLQFGLAPPLFVSRPTMPRMFPPPMMVPAISIQTRQMATYGVRDQSEMTTDNSDIPPPPPPPPPTGSSISVEDAAINSVVVTRSSTPTFPAYCDHSERPKEILKVTKPISSTANVKVVLVHPDDDLPLEQIRLRLPRYAQYALDRVNNVDPSDTAWTKSVQSLLPVAQTETDLAPPPPPFVGQSYFVRPQFDRPVLQRPHWIAPHILQFARPFHFGGQGF